MKPRSLAVAALSCCVPFVPASAQTVERVEQRLSYRDAHLTDAAGRRAFDRRLVQAAEQVCGSAMVTGSRIASPDVLRCRRDALVDARAQVQRHLAMMATGPMIAARATDAVGSN